MKKLLISMLAVATLASCAKEETLSFDKGEAIQFGNAFVDNATRAANDPSYGQNAQALTQFQVWGTVNGGNGLVAIYDGDDVEGKVGSTTVGDKTTTNVWTCDVKQYWINDAIYNFAALVNAPIVDGKFAVDLTAGLPTKVNGFVADGETDLLYSRSAVDIKGKASGNGPVNFTFDHLLSKVKFTVINESVDAEDYSFEVTGITITGNSKGDVTLADKKWDNLSTSKTYSVAKITVDADEAEKTHTAECAQELLLIPGKFNIAFTVDIYNGTTKLGTQSYPISPAVYEYTLAQGCSYNFVIKVKVGEEIKFSVTEQPAWDGDVATPGIQDGYNDTTLTL